MNSSLFLSLLTLTLNSIIECFVLHPNYVNLNPNQIYSRKDRPLPRPMPHPVQLFRKPSVVKGVTKSHPQRPIPVKFNSYPDHFGRSASKKHYSMLMPMENRPLIDLMPMESRRRPTVMVFSRKSGKGSKNFDKQFGPQFSSAFSELGPAFGENFGLDFVKSLDSFSKSNKKVRKPKPSKGTAKGFGQFGQRFFNTEKTNIGKSFKQFFNQF